MINSTASGPGDVSLIVPLGKGGPEFVECLDAIQALSPRPGELIVVDDGASEESCAQAEGAGALVIHTARPHSGPAQARNLGARRATRAILLFADADIKLRPDVVARIAADFAADDDLAAVYGSYDSNPPAQNVVSQYKNLFHHYIHQDASGEASSFWAGCGAIRRDVFLDLGGFSPEYNRPSIEDIELGYRMKKAGYKSRLDKDLQVTHLKHWTLRSLLASDVLDRALPWTALILRDREFPADLNLKMSHRFSVALVFIGLAALLVAPAVPFALALALICVLVLLVLDWRLYRFFAAQRGFGFAGEAVLLHWLYYFYSGLAFAIGALRWSFSVLPVHLTARTNRR